MMSMNHLSHNKSFQLEASIFASLIIRITKLSIPTGTSRLIQSRFSRSSSSRNVSVHPNESRLMSRKRHFLQNRDYENWRMLTYTGGRIIMHQRRHPCFCMNYLLCEPYTPAPRFSRFTKWASVGFIFDYAICLSPGSTSHLKPTEEPSLNESS